MITCDSCKAKDVSIVVRGQFTIQGFCVECHAEMDTEAKQSDMTFLEYWGL